MTVIDSIRIHEALSRLRQARNRANAWMLERIGPEGAPAHRDQPRAWARMPWALALGGELEAAAAVVDWAKRAAIADDGGFRPELVAGAQATMRAYPMAHLAIGAWLIERYDVALGMMSALRGLQHPRTGGIETGLVGPGGSGLQDLLVTAQSGVAALVTAQDDMISNAYRWIGSLYADQPQLPGKLFTLREGDTLVTEPSPATTWLGVVDFQKPRQAFYHPGMAAAFLAGVALRRGDPDAAALGRKYLSLNVQGIAAQFDDSKSVQICKFGWGSATLLIADPTGEYLPQVTRMADWFAARQDADGGWSPSRFLVPEPPDSSRMAKTAEHAMEANAILNALAAAQARAAAR